MSRSVKRLGSTSIITNMMFDDYNKANPLARSRVTSSSAQQIPTGLANYASFKEPLLSSVEFYACQDTLQDSVQNQIYDWTRSEMRDGRLAFCPYSTLLLSQDKKRIIHMIGFDVTGDLLQNVDSKFDRFRSRSSSSSMHSNGGNSYPIHLQESTHLYETFFSIPYNASTRILADVDSEEYFISMDIYSCRDKRNHAIVMAKLCDCLRFYIANAETNNDTFNKKMNDNYQGSYSNTEPSSIHTTIPLPTDMVCLQTLSSIDSATCLILGVWKTEQAYKSFYMSDEYKEMSVDIRSMVAEGTYSDIIEKTSSKRLFTLHNVFRVPHYWE